MKASTAKGQGVGRQGMYKECVKPLFFSVRVSQEIPKKKTYLSILSIISCPPFLIVLSIFHMSYFRPLLKPAQAVPLERIYVLFGQDAVSTN